MSKIPIYFFPGMSSNSLIFEHLHLDSTQFELIFLEWLAVDNFKNLDHYVRQYISLIKHDHPVLVGVSFGGIIAQEISKLIPVKKTIIISSVRCNKEYPKIFRFAYKTGIYRCLPTSMVHVFWGWIKRTASPRKLKRLELYDRYLPLRDKKYLDWCIREILKWKQSTPLDNVIHIHGTKDKVFPMRNIKSAIKIEGGTHAMIIIKYNWFNTHLQTIILKNNNEKDS